jgi:hypothetical protein
LEESHPSSVPGSVSCTKESHPGGGAEADGSGRRAVDVKLDGAADVYWFGNDRLAYSTDIPRRRRRQARIEPDVQPPGPLYTIVDLDGRTTGTIRLPEACDPFYLESHPTVNLAQ